MAIDNPVILSWKCLSFDYSIITAEKRRVGAEDRWEKILIMSESERTEIIIGCPIKVQSALGPEMTYPLRNFNTHHRWLLSNFHALLQERI